MSYGQIKIAVNEFHNASDYADDGVDWRRRGQKQQNVTASRYVLALYSQGVVARSTLKLTRRFAGSPPPKTTKDAAGRRITAARQPWMAARRGT